MSQAHADLDKATPKNIPTDVGAMLDGGARSGIGGKAEVLATR